MGFTVYYLFLLLVHPLLAMWWKAFPKMGAESWKAFVPIYNYFVVFKFGSSKPWWSLLMLIPGIHLVMWMVANVSYIRRFGFFSLGETLQGIFFPYLILWKIANTENLPALEPTNWASPVDVAKRTNGDHVVLFLCLPIIGHAIAYLLSFRSKRIGKKSVVKEWGDSILFALVAASIIRTYVFEPFQIPTGSMEKTLLVGDFLFVNKLAYGPKVPVTPLSYPLVHNTIPWINVPSYLTIEKSTYFRLPGFGDVQRNDVMVFNFPSGDTAIVDPRIPNGLMGHDYHGIVIQEAKLAFIQSHQAEVQTLYATITDSLNKALQAQNYVPNPDYVNYMANQLTEKAIFDRHFGDFYSRFEHWKNQARKVLGVQKIAHTGEGIIQHYGLIYRPVDKRENYIKRCVALPGDEIEIKNSILYVNGKPAWRAPYQNLEYLVSGQPLSERVANNAGLFANEDDFQLGSEGIQVIYLTDEKLAALKRLAPNTTFTLSIAPQYSDSSNHKATASDRLKNLDYFPKDFEVNNTVSNFSKIHIPKKGATVQLTKENIAWYRRIITAYEGHQLVEKNDGIYIDGRKKTSYTFAMNYYWLMGDNRYRSADSRVWGFVPEDHVVGKASIVWFSKGPNGIRWDRVFNLIK